MTSGFPRLRYVLPVEDRACILAVIEVRASTSTARQKVRFGCRGGVYSWANVE